MSTERNAESSITGVPAKGSVETFSHRSLRSFCEPHQPRHRGLRSKMAMFVVALIAVLMGAMRCGITVSNAHRPKTKLAKKLRSLLPRCAPCGISLI